VNSTDRDTALLALDPLAEVSFTVDLANGESLRYQLAVGENGAGLVPVFVDGFEVEINTDFNDTLLGPATGIKFTGAVTAQDTTITVLETLRRGC